MTLQMLDEMVGSPDFIYDPSLVLYLPLWKKDCLSGGIISSDDAYGHLCTVTGATWGIQGRTFDGSDDRINVPDAASLDVLQITIRIWIKPDGHQDINDRLIDKGYGDAYVFTAMADDTIGFQTKVAGVQQDKISTGIFTINEWNCVGVSTNGITGFFYINGVNAGDFTYVNPGSIGVSAFSLGVIGRLDGAGNNYKGIVGEVLINGRGQSIVECQNFELATKWRYR